MYFHGYCIQAILDTLPRPQRTQSTKPSGQSIDSRVGSEGGVGRVGVGFVGSIQGDPRGDDTGNRAGLVRFFDFCNKNQSACISYLGIVGL